MAFIPWPNGVKLCFLFTTGSENWQFCLGIEKVGGAPTETDLNDIATIGKDWAEAELLDNIENDTVLNEVVATDMTTQSGPEVSITSGALGAITGSPTALSNAMCVSLRTDKRGRSYRGRAYVSGFAAAAIVSVVSWATATAAAVAEDFAILKDSLIIEGYNLVVASTQHNGEVTNPAVLTPITAVVVDTLVDSQRRRLGGRGA